jgi:lysophospholipase L1-like esterase
LRLKEVSKVRYTRFIALGDSMTEGMSDEVVKGKYRGWADRVADVLAKDDPNFTYVNLAIRGKLLKQVVEDQIPSALKYIEGKQTLVSFHAGANDVLRPNYKPEVSLPEYERGIKQLTDSGATVIVFTVRRFLAFDRLHMNSEGHRRLANAVLEGLGYEFDKDWRLELPPAKKKNKVHKVLVDILWIGIFLIPWIWRRIRGKSSGDGRSAKYEAPVSWSAP